MANRIDAIIEEICSKNKQTALKSVIERRIRERLEISANTLRRWKNQDHQPDLDECAVIKDVLVEYIPLLKIDDLLDVPESEASGKIEEIFN